MATISSGRWDWWNEYTEKDEVVDCLIMLSDALGRWPKHEEVTEVWPEYTLRFMQEKFGSYDTIKTEAARKTYKKNRGYRVKVSPKKLAFTAEQLLIIAEIAKRPQSEPKKQVEPEVHSQAEPKKQLQDEPRKQLLPQDGKPITTPKSTEVAQVATPARAETPMQAETSARAETGNPPVSVERKRTRPGRKPTFSDEQLLAFLRQIVAANDGIVPTAVRAKELLRKQNGPSLMTMTNRLGPLSSWERRLENAS